MVNSVVVALRDGRKLKGYVYDVSMERGDFHLYESDDPAETRATLVKLDECKVVCFVRSLTGNPNYKENKTEFTEKRRWGRPYEVFFEDGERLIGTVEIYHPEKLGFYLIPPDPGSNNLRIFVVKSSTTEVRPLDEGTGKGSAGQFVAPEPSTYPVDRRIEVVLRLLREGNLQALAGEVLLAPQVIEYWRDAFLDGVRTGISEAGLAEMRRRSGEGAPAEKADRTPVDRRLDLVLRLCRQEDENVLSQTTLVPVKAMNEWKDRGLEAGKDALRILGTNETARPPVALKAHYDALLLPKSAAGRPTPSFLDTLSDILRKGPGKGERSGP